MCLRAEKITSYNPPAAPMCVENIIQYRKISEKLYYLDSVTKILFGANCFCSKTAFRILSCYFSEQLF